MSKHPPSQPGFVMPPTGPPTYPSSQHQQYPPQQQQPYYPSYPSQPTNQQPPVAYQTQPFPAPIQHSQSGGYGQQGGIAPANWCANTNFQRYLLGASSFHVKQKVELLEALVGWETENKYTVKDQSGNKLFYVGEESGCFPRQFFPGRRPFTLNVRDSTGQNVLVYDRDVDCSCCCGFFCPDSLTVSTANGLVLGTVKEKGHLLYPKYSIKDATGKTVLRIEGPLCPLSYGCGPVVFRVTNLNGVSVGTISKEWSGFVRELFTDADYFSMSFPVDLDAAIKAVCIGALFLIDYQYFEQGSGGDQGGRRLFG